MSCLERSRLWSAHTGLPKQQCSGTGAEKSAEVVVAQPGEGPNLLMQGADGRFSMSAAQQKGNQHHGDDGAGGTRLMEHGRQQAFTAFDQQRALTVSLMEQVCDPKNLVRAYRRVYSNKGKPGVDGMTVHELADWLRKHSAALTASLLDGTYRPQPVRGVSIPKPGGGQRQLGIPVVVDRLVQQMILQAFLRPRLLLNGKLGISPKSVNRAKEKIRQSPSSLLQRQGITAAAQTLSNAALAARPLPWCLHFWIVVLIVFLELFHPLPARFLWSETPVLAGIIPIVRIQVLRPLPVPGG